MKQKRTVITTVMVRGMRQARAVGETYWSVAARYGVTIPTVMRHTDERQAAKQHMWEDRRKARSKGAS